MYSHGNQICISYRSSYKITSSLVAAILRRFMLATVDVKFVGVVHLETYALLSESRSYLLLNAWHKYFRFDDLMNTVVECTFGNDILPLWWSGWLWNWRFSLLQASQDTNHPRLYYFVGVMRKGQFILTLLVITQSLRQSRRPTFLWKVKISYIIPLLRCRSCDAPKSPAFFFPFLLLLVVIPAVSFSPILTSYSWLFLSLICPHYDVRG